MAVVVRLHPNYPRHEVKTVLVAIEWVSVDWANSDCVTLLMLTYAERVNPDTSSVVIFYCVGYHPSWDTINEGVFLCLGEEGVVVQDDGDMDNLRRS